MLKFSHLVLGLAIVLAACSRSEQFSESVPAPMGDIAEMKMQAGAGFAEQADLASPPPPGSEPSNPSDQSFLAYRYNHSFELPAENIIATAKSHADLCMQAGPSKCQVLGSSQSAYSKTNVSAQLSFRAQPDWLVGFKQEIYESVEAADGKIRNESSSVEDLTRSILDTDARLKAKKTLRERLEKHLETRDAKLGDLLAMERELARVQGEIESATSQLNALRKRVSMSVVDINYQSRSVAVARGNFAPIAEAFDEFFFMLSSSAAAVILFVAAILPWLLLIIPLFWLIRYLWRKRKARKAAEPRKTTKNVEKPANTA